MGRNDFHFFKNGIPTFTYSDRHCGSKFSNSTAIKNFRNNQMQVQYRKQKNLSPGGLIRVSLQCIYRGFFIVTSKKNISD